MTEPVPFFRPDLEQAEIDEVVATLRSGWLTTGPRTAAFEQAFAEAVGARHAVALSSCTAALHLATVCLDLAPGQLVLVPTMTFAATAEVIRYAGAVPVLVDCDSETLNLDLDDAERKLTALRTGTAATDRLPASIDREAPVVGIVPVHVAGRMLDLDALDAFAARHDLWRVEDAAHAFPAARRVDRERTGGAARETTNDEASWRRCGENTAEVTCFSFYANKTITTGEGGMAVTDDAERAARIRSLSLHGLSKDAWGRYTAKGAWDYRIVAPGYKYNLTDIAAALGLHQLRRAETMRRRREEIATLYAERLADIDEIELPPVGADHRLAAVQHAWHLFQIKLRPEALAIDRDAFLDGLRERGIGTSVHWRPLHLHPYWSETFGWLPEHLPTASAVWRQTISLPLFPTMRRDEIDRVVDAVRDLCRQHRRSGRRAPRPVEV
ncbi:MAG: DegT/DnrJ/EryC1/StrS family aminotransferase [Acidobacteriota bacterium]